MGSFISISEAAPTTVPKRRFRFGGILRFTILLAVAFCSMLGAWRYVRKLSPEVELYTFAAHKKIAYARELDKAGLPKIVIYGGSSCAFGVNTDQMRGEFHLQAVNFGLHAGMGPVVLTGLALKYTNPGDTLIVSLEPILLNMSFDWPALGDQISYALKAPDLCEGGPLRIQRRGAFGVFLTLRPGAENILRFLPSQLRHQYVEYPRSTFSPSGWQRYDVHAEPKARGVGTVISADSQMLLKRLKKYCLEHSIRVAYAMPWLYCDGSRLSTYKETFARFLYEMNKLIPVLRDPTLGTDTDPNDFADGPLHLRPPAATRRAEQLAKLIIEWRTWQPKELAKYFEPSRSDPE